MIDTQAVSALTQLLWMSPQDKVYCILDGASIPTLLDQLYGDPRPEFECLYHGESITILLTLERAFYGHVDIVRLRLR